ncbi:MAG: DUF4386 domain-containing protein [Muricauda sp.]|nr:DUF4386 domain-containing protein [Allomuricauda sp.]MBO6533893.1 DUF4386 domain-containing protein [Allomuricauda sp.]MBO6588672.1 DUF4386 domain-containing protein [Allomuricauda sp.]MBO6618189.1 DUF4386 domain-containing protein [Allomuricauda sp.]MBO6644210.1 DUF4386 domain-containing protein [Allomuricauda sp.]MBO6747787.1 DUF4386 domain-containing protein [Allomuricauda sp.]
MKKNISLSKAALIAGIGLLIMTLTVPFAEFKIIPDLVNPNSALETANNITNNLFLFNVAIFLIFITIVADIVVAWALYVFLKPVNKSLSLLTAWFRLLYTAVYLVAITNLIKVFTLTKGNSYFLSNSQDQISEFMLFYIKSYKYEWFFGLVLFGIYLIILGFLVLKASYIPKIMGWLLIIAGIGYVVGHLKVFLYPNINTSLSMFTALGELVFMLWLLIRGSRTKEFQIS